MGSEPGTNLAFQRFNTKQLNWDWSTGSPYNVQGGDSDGVGHFHAKNNAGKIILKMLNSSCLGAGCAVDYVYGPVN